MNIEKKKFITVIFLVSIWVHLSETLRYFFLVMPEIHSFLNMVPNVAELNISTFSLWGIWDTVLAGLITWNLYLTSEKFGYSLKSSLVAGFVSGTFFFFLFWFGMANMALSDWGFVPAALLFCYLEAVVASMIANKMFLKS